MTTDEFEVIDELYFVISYEDLQKVTEFSDERLIHTLKNIYKQGWIRVYKTADEEMHEHDVDLDNKAQAYFYLATKSGLHAHNS